MSVTRALYLQLLYCEINNVLSTPKRILEFINSNSLDKQLLSSSTLLLLSETLMQIKDDPNALNLAQELNVRALNDRMEESEVKRAIINLRKMKQDDKALELLESVFKRSPSLKNNSSLRELSAKARMDLAKKCMETGRDKTRPKNIQGRAWDLCREYLANAENDLKVALDFVTNEFDRDYIERDTEFLKHLQQISKKPEHKGPRGNMGQQRNSFPRRESKRPSSK